MQSGYRTKSDADRAAEQYEKIGIKTKIVKQIYWVPYPPHNDVLGWVVWVMPVYHRPSKRKRKYRADGSIDGVPRF
jgi:hypothetical protein